MSDDLWLQALTPEERLIAEMAVTNFRELNETADAAADGTVLDVSETMAIRQGRELTRRTLETSLQRQVEAAEKKGPLENPTRVDAASTAAATSGTADAKPAS